MDQPPATTAQTPPATPQAPPEQPRFEAPPDGEPPSGSPGFAARGRMRRRARFLRKARELAYRDLGGLVFNLHRFGQRNDDLVLSKLATLEQLDRELRALESSLEERQQVTVLREAGVTACPRCAAIHSSQDRYCPTCGLSVSRHTDLPISGPAGGPPDGSATTPTPPAPASAPVGSPAAGSSPPPPPATPSSAPQPGAHAAPLSPPGEATASPPGGGPYTSSPVPDFTAQRSGASEPAPSPRPDGQGDQPTRIIRPPAGGA